MVGGGETVGKQGTDRGLPQDVCLFTCACPLQLQEVSGKACTPTTPTSFLSHIPCVSLCPRPAPPQTARQGSSPGLRKLVQSRPAVPMHLHPSGWQQESWGPCLLGS